ncbi:MAG: cytochrome c family protein [Proteobacteria bacterium]|nr:cytochrome c family protein [Pseudomonadota bacterium]MBU1716008.1 cytochrome c family protein [Pseudomonadota bacterium]
MKKATPPFLAFLLSISLFCCLNTNDSFALENSQCMECHGDQSLARSGTEDINQSYINIDLFVDEERFNHSVHHTNEITCVDCHADITELIPQGHKSRTSRQAAQLGFNFDNEVPHKADLAPVICTSCHEEQGSAFISSSHMKARRKGIVMNCYACHDYHYVEHLEAASVAKRGSTFCLRCHNPYQSHDWLSQKAAHFDSVECSVCHAPQAKRHIHLNFYDLVTTKSLSGDEILNILAISEAEFMSRMDKNTDGRINTDEFDDLILMLRQKTVYPIVHAELVVEPGPAVHSVTKEGAIRECTQCHAPNSPFFSAVTIALSRTNGMVDHFEVDRAILEGYHTRHFSALGGTRIKLLDKIGLLMLVGAVAGIFTHLFARVVTIPIRRKRDKNSPADQKSADPDRK